VPELVEIRVPTEQSEGTRSQVARWLKGVGDSVEADEPLIEVETDKVTVEIPSPGRGVLREILKQEQEEVAPGEVLGRIEIGAASTLASAVRNEGSRIASAGRQEAIAGDARGTPAHVPRGARAAQSGPAQSQPAQPSPAVRRLLAERGLDANSITGTGLGGRITVDDVLRYDAGAAEAAKSRASAVPPRARSGGDDRGAAPGRLVTHSPMRRRIAERMVESLLHTAPHVTTVFEADMTAVLAHRARHREAFELRGAPLTLTAYFLAACVDAIRAVPEANSRWTDDALEVFDTIDIGVATALEDKGLVVPVVRNVQALDLEGIARELAALVARAREDRLTPADVRGGTFTISNHGVSGSLVATPIVINQPQSAILGVGKLEKRPVVIDRGGREEIVAQPRCYVSLTIDHRVMDGHRANRFLETFVQRIEGWNG
jgi:2-oxoglutarate dehydrogenase E2 component (dihydrolipoamide succinyltransferase)